MSVLTLGHALFILLSQSLAIAEASALPEQGPSVNPVEATSLAGEALFRPALDPAFREKQEALLQAALAERKAKPKSVEAWIWVGRRQAYLGRYGEAVDTYGEALKKLGEDARLYRHRGHRYLSTRRLELAIADFERAAELIAGRPDIVEPDGLPNARGIPTSTLGTNVWYHLGLVRYLKADYAGALAAYRECETLSKNPDMDVATAYWLYLTLRRLGRSDEAAAVLAPIHEKLEIIENDAYHHLLLLYRGKGSAEALLAEARGNGAAALATTGYGVGAFHLLSGNEPRAQKVWKEIVATDAWASFGYLAAEAELVH